MAVRINRTIAGEFALLTPRRDGPVLWWSGPGTSVRFAINAPGGTWTRVDEPSRFGGTPRSSAEFRRFAERFVAAGAERRRPRAGARRRRVGDLAHESARRKRHATVQRRDSFGRFL